MVADVGNFALSLSRLRDVNKKARKRQQKETTNLCRRGFYNASRLPCPCGLTVCYRYTMAPPLNFACRDIVCTDQWNQQ